MKLLAAEQGMTLIEVLAAIILLTFVLVPLASTFNVSVFSTEEARLTSTALALAQQEMERFMAGVKRPANELPFGFEIDTQIIAYDAEGYETIVVEVRWLQREMERKVQLAGLRKR
ncbi:MAG: type IV pilus modification PilV family protein [bacterium]